MDRRRSALCTGDALRHINRRIAASPGEALSRRRFLAKLADSGGAAAFYAAMQALGLAAPSDVYSATPFPRPRAPADSQPVVILGAGIAGLIAAYELANAGYACTVLEAGDRPGGRNRTVRGGDVVASTNGTTQRCNFEPGLYFNAGPSRFPGSHTGVISYCRALGVEIETAVTTNRNALLSSVHLLGGKPMQIGSIADETRGLISEMLAKSIQQGALNSELKASDVGRIVEFLRAYGELSPDLVHRARAPGGTGLLNAEIWRWTALGDSSSQPVMLQPKGGMDQLPLALFRRLGDSVRLRCKVSAVHNTPKGVRVAYYDANAGTQRVIDAAYCVCTVPPYLVSRLLTNLAATHLRALASFHPESASRIAWQAQRFWETDAQIFGGTSFTGDATTMIAYPSDAFLSSKGVLVGAYARGLASEELASHELTEQYGISRLAVEQLHPARGKDLQHPVAVSWQEIPNIEGGWSKLIVRESGQAPRTVLSEPDQRIFFAGDYLSELSGWQEGAVRSSHRAVEGLDRHAHAVSNQR